MEKINLLNKLVKTEFTNSSKEFLSDLIRKEFETTDNEEKAFILLQIAWKYQLKCLDSMLYDYSLTDFKWF